MFRYVSAYYPSNIARTSLRINHNRCTYDPQLPLVVFYNTYIFHDSMNVWSILGCIVIIGSAIAIVSNKESKNLEPSSSAASSSLLMDGRVGEQQSEYVSLEEGMGTPFRLEEEDIQEDEVEWGLQSKTADSADESST